MRMSEQDDVRMFLLGKQSKIQTTGNAVPVQKQNPRSVPFDYLNQRVRGKRVAVASHRNVSAIQDLRKFLRVVSVIAEMI